MLASLKSVLIFLLAIANYQCSASFWPPIFYPSKQDTSTSSPKATGIKSILDQATWIKTSTATANPPYAPLPPPPPANSPSPQINVSTPTISVSLPSVYSSASRLDPPPPQPSITYLSSSGIHPSSNDWRFYNQYPARSPSVDLINNQPIDLAIDCRFAAIYRPDSTGVYSGSSPTSPLPLHLSLHPQSTHSHYPTSHLSSPATIPSSSLPTYPSSTGFPYSHAGHRYFAYPCVIPSTMSPYQQVALASDATPAWSLPPLFSPLAPLPSLSLFPMVNKMDDDSPRKSWTHGSSDSEHSPSDHPSQPSHHPSSQVHKSARAVAELSGPSGVTGTVVFTQIGQQSVSMEGKVMGLVPGPHGLHIYELPFIGGDCTTAGDHYNPKKTEHGGKHDWSRHIGDLGNIYVYSDGVATFEEKDLQISLHGGNSIINHTLGISEKADDLGRGNDFPSKKDGNSGMPIACGIIHLRPI